MYFELSSLEGVDSLITCTRALICAVSVEDPVLTSLPKVHERMEHMDHSWVGR
jgi:hypothetical protein